MGSWQALLCATGLALLSVLALNSLLRRRPRLPRFTLSQLSNKAFIEALCMHSFAVVELPAHEASLLQSALRTVGQGLQQLHGHEPSVRRYQSRVRTASSPHRIVMSFIPGTMQGSEPPMSDSDDSEDDDGNEADEPALAQPAAAAEEAHTLLLKVSRMVTEAIESAVPAALEGVVLNDGKLDGFWYPPAGFQIGPAHATAVLVDRDCPCASHSDPGVVTAVVETAAGIEVQSTADRQWRRLQLRPNEVCVLTGLQLTRLSGGALPACPHRVAPSAVPRASFTLEMSRQAAAALTDPLSRAGKALWDPIGGFSR